MHHISELSRFDNMAGAIPQLWHNSLYLLCLNVLPAFHLVSLDQHKCHTAGSKYVRKSEKLLSNDAYETSHLICGGNITILLCRGTTFIVSSAQVCCFNLSSVIYHVVWRLFNQSYQSTMCKHT